MKATKIILMVSALLAAPAVAQQGYEFDSGQFDEGQFEGRMGWLAEGTGDAEYYAGYATGRDDAREEESRRQLEQMAEDKAWRDQRALDALIDAIRRGE